MPDDFTIDDWDAVCAALSLDPAATLSVNISSGWVRIVHADQAVTSAEIVDPARVAAAEAEAQRLADAEAAAAAGAAADEED